MLHRVLDRHAVSFPFALPRVMWPRPPAHAVCEVKGSYIGMLVGAPEVSRRDCYWSDAPDGELERQQAPSPLNVDASIAADAG